MKKAVLCLFGLLTILCWYTKSNADMVIFDDQFRIPSPTLLWQGSNQDEYSADTYKHSLNTYDLSGNPVPSDQLTDPVITSPLAGDPATNKVVVFRYKKSVESWSGRIIGDNNGINLNGLIWLKFKAARGPTMVADVKINNFFMQYSNNNTVSSDQINLGPTWQEFIIKVSLGDLANIKTLFGFIITNDQNPENGDVIEFLIDDVKYIGGADDCVTIVDPTFDITGTIADLNGNPIPDVSVSISENSLDATTDTHGQYTFLDLPEHNTYTIIPTKTNYGFSPKSLSIVALAKNEKDIDFSGSQFYVNGYIKDQYDIPISSVSVCGIHIPAKDGDAVITSLYKCQTDAAGFYQLLLPSSCYYKITPYRENYYAFSPAERTYTPLITYQENQDYIGNSCHISGYIRNVEGQGISNIIVLLCEDNDNIIKTDYTAENGYYEFNELEPRTYYIIPAESYYNFKPIDRYITLIDKMENMDFISSGYFSLPHIKITGGAKGYINTSRNEKARIYISSDDELNSTLYIRIYDLTSTLVWETEVDVNNEYFKIIDWPGRNMNDEPVASGIYIVHIKGKDLNKIEKIAGIK